MDIYESNSEFVNSLKRLSDISSFYKLTLDIPILLDKKGFNKDQKE